MKNFTFKKKLILLTCFCFMILLNACSSSNKNKAEEILSETQMVEVLTDIYLTEGKLNSLRIPKDSAEYLFKTIEPTIFAEHGIDSTVYKRSFQYYITNYEELSRIYELVIDSLSNRELIQRERDSRTLGIEEDDDD